MTKKKLREQIRELNRKLRLVAVKPNSIEAKVIIDYEKALAEPGFDLINSLDLVKPSDYSEFIKKYPHLSSNTYKPFFGGLKWISFADYYSNRAEFPPLETRIRSKFGVESNITPAVLKRYTLLGEFYQGGLIKYLTDSGLEILV